MTSRIRPFTESDVPLVADLHRRVFRLGPAPSSEAAAQHREYFRNSFLASPWQNGECPSLVYVDDREQIGGFVGVASRTMTLNGRRLRMAISSQFMVDDTPGSPVAAVRLLKAFLDGPQDLSLADEATDRARALWESVGGTTARLLSLAWVRVLRPAAFAASRARRSSAWARSARAVTPFCRLADAAVRRLPGPFRFAAPPLVAEPMDGVALNACINETARGRALRPCYDDRFAGAVLDAVSRKEGAGELHRAVLRDASGRLAGWYLYHATRGAVGEVVHVGARPESVASVLTHLFEDAQRRGVTALSGRLDPALMGPIAAQSGFFHHRGEWVLVHARMKAAVDAVQRGDAFLSRLEGEWCLRYRLGFA